MKLAIGYSKVPNNRGPTIIYFDQFSHPHVLIKHPHDYFFREKMRKKISKIRTCFENLRYILKYFYLVFTFCNQSTCVKNCLFFHFSYLHDYKAPPRLLFSTNFPSPTIIRSPRLLGTLE